MKILDSVNVSSKFVISFSVESVEGSELKLERLTRADMGAYLCIASNR